MSPQEIDNLRKEVKHRMVDLGLDLPGSYDLLIPYLKTPASRQILSNAMTGYRNGPAAKAVLENLFNLLQAWPPGTDSPCGEHIHEGERQNN